MTVYQIVVFLHVLAAISLMATVGVEWAVRGPFLRARDAAEARPWVDVLAGAGRLAGPSSMTILATGLYLAFRVWGRHVWIEASLAAFVAMGIVAVSITARRGGALQRDLAAGTTDGADLAARLHDPMLEMSLRVRTAVSLGIVFLMTTKPAGWIGPLVIVAVTLAGLLWALPAFSRARRGAVEIAG